MEYILRLFAILLLFPLSCKSRETKSKDEKAIDYSWEKWKNRPIYSTLTVAILDTVNDEELEQVVIDNIFSKFDGLIGEEYLAKEVEITSAFSKGRKMMYSTWIVEGEVNNGGFNQLYYNNNWHAAQMAVEGFKTLEAPAYVELMKKANKTYLEIKPHLDSLNDGSLESFVESYNNDPFAVFDNEFYRLDSSQNLSKLRIGYIKNHKEEFIDK